MLKLIKDDEWLLDVGCGNGMTYEMLMKHKRQIFYKGIDFSETVIKNCQERWKGTTCFEVFDIGDLDKLSRPNDPVKEYDTVYIRHCLESLRDWKESIRQMFRLAKKRVIIDMRRGLSNIETVNVSKAKNDMAFCWNINYDEINHLCRDLTVNVSFLRKKIGTINGFQDSFTNTFIVLGKKLDDIVFTLDDFHINNHKLDLLLDLKKRFPKLKVTLFAIPSKCPISWLKELKEKYDWMEFAVHGWFHDVTNRTGADAKYYPEECKNWTKEDANKYLEMAEKMGVFVKGFKAPGWLLNPDVYEVLKERGYWIMDHTDYKGVNHRPDNFPKLYETGSLAEINGHIQEVRFNGLENIIQNKNPFMVSSNFYFISEVIGTDFDKYNRLEELSKEL